MSTSVHPNFHAREENDVSTPWAVMNACPTVKLDSGSTMLLVAVKILMNAPREQLSVFTVQSASTPLGHTGVLVDQGTGMSMACARISMNVL